jgi:hypothetical protein
MKKDNFQLVIDDLNRKGIPFITHTQMHEKLMKNPEYRKLFEKDEKEIEEAYDSTESVFETRPA